MERFAWKNQQSAHARSAMEKCANYRAMCSHRNVPTLTGAKTSLIQLLTVLRCSCFRIAATRLGAERIYARHEPIPTNTLYRLSAFRVNVKDATFNIYPSAKALRAVHCNIRHILLVCSSRILVRQLKLDLIAPLLVSHIYHSSDDSLHSAAKASSSTLQATSQPCRPRCIRPR